MTPKSIYLLSRFFMSFAFNLMFTAAIIYRIDVVNLEIYQLILLGTALEIAVLLFEVPTGVVADLYSRKWSVIIGLFIIASGFFLELSTSIFVVIFMAQIVWGLGETFISGAFDAWLSDETHHTVKDTLLTGKQYSLLGSVGGILLSGFIGSINPVYAMALAGTLMSMLAIYLIVFMPEQKTFEKVRQTWRDYFSQLGKGFTHIKKHHALRILFIIMLFLGLYSEGIDRTYQVHVLDNLGLRNITLSPVWIIAGLKLFMVTSGALLIAINKRVFSEAHHVNAWLTLLFFLMAFGIFSFGFFSTPLLALIGFVLFHAARASSEPILINVMVENTPPSIKATVLSSFGQLDAIGQLASGALMVSIGAFFSLPVLYFVTAGILLVPFITAIFLPKTVELDAPL